MTPALAAVPTPLGHAQGLQLLSLSRENWHRVWPSAATLHSGQVVGSLCTNLGNKAQTQPYLFVASFFPNNCFSVRKYASAVTTPLTMINTRPTDVTRTPLALLLGCLISTLFFFSALRVEFTSEF